MLQGASIDTSVRLVRPLTLGFVVVDPPGVDHWTKSACATVDPTTKDYVKQYMEVALAYCSNQSARLAVWSL